MKHDDGLNTRERYCLHRHGYWCAEGPGGLWVFLPAGADPADGAPLTRARLATAFEAELWKRGDYADLGRVVLADAGVAPPPRRPTLWGRLLRWLGAAE